MKVQKLITEIDGKIPTKYKSSNKCYIFKQMWEATCLNRRVKFNSAWTIESSNMVRPIDLKREFGFSSSEMEVYNLFRQIYSGNTYRVDFSFYFSRWKAQSNEYQIAISWLDHQFYF